MTSRNLRVRHSGGATTIDIGAEKSTAGGVARLIETAVGIPAAEQEWRCGFPPRPLSKLHSTDLLPSDIDMLHVGKVDSGSATVDFSVVVADAPADKSSAPTSTPETPGLDIVNDSTIDEPPLTDPEGFVVRRVIDADNSCLFNSIGYVLERSRTNAPQLRRKVADAVRSDPITYNDAFLGKDIDEYAAWIMKDSSWGGQIELSIFSRLFRTEIAAFDVIRFRYDIYGTEEGYKRRISVIYDGIHYDALAFCFDPSLPEDMDVTQFSPRDDNVMNRARALCAEQHRAKAFTDTSNFTLRCLVCQEGLVGQKEAAEHAKKTGHSNFSEY
mmetsp:Transcript_36625/g.74662  ORF Transcript_36625/g.74662 Transcript_36625/m.74662 type:complete len:328 (-) Transcript_36625:1839-2822(-)